MTDPISHEKTETSLDLSGAQRLDRVGRFVIRKELGRGGMGVVLLADDEQLGRQVAIKLIKVSSDDEEHRRRFLREARSAAQLNHPNIATVYDVGEHAGQPFLAMEFVEGKTLSTRLREGALAVDEARKVAEQLAAALACAHRAGVVHRDLKPGNVMLSASGPLKLLDFGLARPESGSDSEGDGPITGSGVIVGTPAYMSPEQARGMPLTTASDVFSLGVLLYEVVSGISPFERKSVFDMLNAIITDAPPPVAHVRTDVPSGLAAVIDRCLQKAPDERPSSDSLIALLNVAPEQAAPSPRAPAERERVAGRTAVLPFKNTVGNADHDWVGAGLKDTLQHELRRSAGVTVVGEAEIGAALAQAHEPEAVADALAAQYVVSGSYQVAGGRLRISATLLDRVADQAQAAERIDGSLDDVFDAQDALVAEVRRLLSTGADAPSGPSSLHDLRPSDLEAFEWYSRGLLQISRFDAHGIDEAGHAFRMALERDPDYPLAHAGLGFHKLMSFLRTGMPPIDEVISTFERALALDRRIAMAHTGASHGYMLTGRTDKAIEHAKEATALDPEDALAWEFLGVASAMNVVVAGDGATSFTEGVEALRRSLAINPIRPSALNNFGLYNLMLGNLDEAWRSFNRALRIELEQLGKERWVGAQVLRGVVELYRGDLSAAVADLAAGLASLTDDTHMFATNVRTAAAVFLGEARFQAGAFEEAIASYRAAVADAESHLGLPGIEHNLVRAHYGLGKAHHALGDRAASDRHFDEANRRDTPELRSRGGYACWYAWTGYDRASALVVRGDVDAAVEALKVAQRHGWRIPQQLAHDRAFEGHRELPAIKVLVS